MLTNDFENILSKITRSSDQVDKNYKVLNFNEDFIYKVERKIPDYILAIPDNDKITINSLYEKLLKILTLKNHVATPQICKILIGLFYLTKEYTSKEITNVQIFNNILLNINSIKLRQIIFLPISRENNGNYFSYDCFDFQIGKTDFDKLKYQTERCGSDVYDRSIKKYRNNITIERTARKIKCIDVFSLDINTKKLNENDIILLQHLIEEYFYKNSDFYNIEMIDTFQKQQDLYYALSTYKLSKSIINFSSFNLNFFYDFSTPHKGWCTPAERILSANIDYEMKWKKNYDNFINYFKINNNIKEKQNWNLIKNFSYFMRLGMDLPDPESLKLNANLGSGYIHFIVALEMVFGSNNEQVIKRIATLETIYMKNEYKKNYDLIKLLINNRNSYIHKGFKINETDYKKLELICRTILMWILNLNKHYSDFDIDKICKKIDAVNALIISDQEIPKNLIEELFINNMSVEENFY